MAKKTSDLDVERAASARRIGQHVVEIEQIDRSCIEPKLEYGIAIGEELAAVRKTYRDRKDMAGWRVWLLENRPTTKLGRASAYYYLGAYEHREELEAQLQSTRSGLEEGEVISQNIKDWSRGLLVLQLEETTKEKEKTRRTPSNMTEIKKAFRDAGCAVTVLGRMEPAISPHSTDLNIRFPNLVVSHKSGDLLAFVKDPSDPEPHNDLTEEEQRFCDCISRKAPVIKSVKQVESLVKKWFDA